MNFSYIKEFGWSMALLHSLSFKFGGKFRREFNSKVVRYLNDNYGYLVPESRTIWNQNEVRKIVWTSWWQGLDEAPLSIKKCITSVKENLPPDCDYIVIDKYNYKNYIQIPEYIMKKVEEGIISFTHLADYIRFKLMSEYGGFWLDATFFVTKNLDNSFFTTQLYTPRMHVQSMACISQGRWVVGAWYSPQNDEITQTIYRFLEEYWKKTNAPIDYFLCDAFIEICYKRNDKFRNLINQLPPDGDYMFEMEKMMNMELNVEKYSSLTKKCGFHRISWKKKYFPTINNEITYYGYWMQK